MPPPVPGHAVFSVTRQVSAMTSVPPDVDAPTEFAVLPRTWVLPARVVSRR